jgi:AraC-like DNA-binding protein
MIRPVLLPYSSLLGAGIAPAMQRIGPLTELPALLRGFGVRPATVFRRANLASDALADPEGRIPYAAIGPLLEECVAATGCQHFGLLAGSRWRLENLGPPGEIAGSCATVERALESFASFHWLNASGAVAFVLRDDGITSFGYAVFEAGILRGVQQIYDLALAVAVNMVRDLSGNPRWAPAVVRMSRARPDDPRPYRRFFGAPIRFDAESSTIRFPSTFGATPVPGADEPRRRLLEAKLRVLGREGTGPRLRRMLRVAMMFGQTSGDSLAAAMALSRRTLNRRLAERGTTFQRELASARFEVAQQLLRNTTLPVSEIASALGYAELSPFVRAFRRWTGQSPAAWRRAAPRPSGGAE